MQINIKSMPLGTKIGILLEVLAGTLLIIAGIISKEILGTLAGILVWIFVIDMFTIEMNNQVVKMLEILCDVQQEILAEKCSCSREEVDDMCTERLKERNEKSR